MRRPERAREQRNRVRIAQASARLIAEHGLTDWTAAKRKACRELGLADDEALPNNEEIEQALHDYNSLFRAATHPASLRSQREAALEWMQRLAQWDPVLIGGVAEGWATEHSDVRIELEAEDSKPVELALINAGVRYVAAATQGANADTTQLLVEGETIAVSLLIVSPHRRRHRSRRDDDARMSTRELQDVLSADGPGFTRR